eukprot:NODE_366_length_8705_cov_0.466070.p9 type:complete len:141 gc:universal NODE_366_length_8705_cov_0.466070:1998-1576(-)
MFYTLKDSTLKGGMRKIPQNWIIHGEFGNKQTTSKLDGSGNLIPLVSQNKASTIYAFIGGYIEDEGIVTNAVYMITGVNEYYLVTEDYWIEPLAFRLETWIVSGSEKEDWESIISLTTQRTKHGVKSLKAYLRLIMAKFQ